MAIENKYGKSAVDATRKNALPLYIDEMAGQISGDFLPISGGTLTGELKAPYLTMLAQDDTDEGGEIKLEPATSSWSSVYLDSYHEVFRIRNNTVNALVLDLNSNSKTLTIPRGNVWAGDGSSPVGEVDCGVRNQAGTLFLYSGVSSTGNRGLWVGAHGTGAARAIIQIDTNNKATFSETPGAGASWIKGRDDAIFKMNSITSTKYNAILSMKTTNGSWEMGEYDSGTSVNRLYFTYAKDTNYNNNTNTTAQAYLTPRDSGAYPISLASIALNSSTNVLTITDPNASIT